MKNAPDIEGKYFKVKGWSANMNDWPSIEDLASSVQAGKVSAISLVEKSLEIIECKKEFNAIIALVADRARSRAQKIVFCYKGYAR